MSKMKIILKSFHPAYFAMVMATGIVSIAAYLQGMGTIARALFWLNVVVYVILWMMTFGRLACFPCQLLSDLTDHHRGVSFFTKVAGTCVLGSQFLIFSGNFLVSKYLWYLGIILGTLLTYAVFTGLAIKENKPSLSEGISGGWLLAVVATQSISVLGGLLYPQFKSHQEVILFLTLYLWLFGGMLYIWMISLIFYRYYFFKFSPADLTPPYWINMGAMAISTLAGTILVPNAQRSTLLKDILPFLKSFTLLFWATATWWIPMLFILGIWRHIIKKFKIIYDPLYWGAVFPLGMYTTCTFQLANVLGLPLLYEIAKYFIYISFLAWAITFLGLIHSMLSSLMGRLVDKTFNLSEG